MSDPSNFPPGESPHGQQPYEYGGPPPPYADPDRRPGTVTAAGMITITMSSISLLLFGIVLVAILAARDEVIDEIDTELADQPGMEDFTGDELANAVIVIMLVFVVWCLIAIVTAALSLRRQNWARIVTVVSASMAALLSLVSIGALVTIIPLAAAIAAIALYFVGGANEWYARRSAPGTPPAGGQWG